MLPLTLAVGARAAEPAPSEVVQTESSQLAPAPGFDLRSESVRNVLKATAATQASYEHRIETAPREKPDLAAVLRERPEPPAKRETTKPRLPDRPPPCDGFFSCGLEVLLGLEDFDDELYGRVERQRLMNQGSFTDSSKINASVGLPISSSAARAASGPLQPR